MNLRRIEHNTHASLHTLMLEYHGSDEKSHFSDFTSTEYNNLHK
jgi:hypothetical protein